MVPPLSSATIINGVATMFKNPFKLLSNRKKQKWLQSAVFEIEERGFVNFKKPLSMADRELLNKTIKKREEYISLFTMIPYPEIADEEEYQGGEHEIQLS